MLKYVKNKNIYAAMLIMITALMSTIGFAQEGEEPGGWSYSVGLGIVSSPSYLGDDDQQLSLFPHVEVSYSDRFFASFLGGIGYNVINSKGWRVGPILQLNLGRYDDGDNPLLIAGDETDDLVGLGDVEASVELGGFVEYTYQRVQGLVEVRQDTGGGHEGLVAGVEICFTGSFQIAGKPAFYAIGPEFSFGDDDYTSAFFDVDAEQSAASGLPEYDADGGVLAYGLQVSLFIPIRQNMSLMGFAGYDQITGDAEESSLVEERGSVDQYLVGIVMAYEF